MSRVANKAQGVAVGLTMVEKILARTSGRSQVRAGDNIELGRDSRGESRHSPAAQRRLKRKSPRHCRGLA